MAEEARLIAEKEEQERLEREQKEEEERLRLELKVRSGFVKFGWCKTQPQSFTELHGSEIRSLNNRVNVFLCDRTGSAERMS